MSKIKVTTIADPDNDTTAIVAEKQRLRDITATVDSMTTLEELKQASVEAPSLTTQEGA